MINPGGPGGSGVNLLLREGIETQTIVDEGRYPDHKGLEGSSGLSFDIIGFDPRGVNHTTPSPSCFPDDASREFWKISNQAQGILGANNSFPLVWARDKALATSCSEKMGTDWDGVGKYMNTPQVATDMVAIIEAMGEFREKAATSILSKTPRPGSEVQAIVERTRWRKGKEMLQYWGFSYGTLLGATFASLYPEKVLRVALDGVCDAEDYYAGTWLSNLINTDSIIDSFLRQCNDAGPERCPLYSKNGIEGSRAKYTKILQDLVDHPLPVPAFGKYSADVVTRTDAMYEVRMALYSPMTFFQPLARIFAALADGNGTELVIAKQSGHRSFCPIDSCTDNPYSDACYAHDAGIFMPEISAAILCTDAPGNQLSWTAEDHFQKWQTLKHQSQYLGDYWAEITMFCANWDLRPAWPFSWPESASVGNGNGRTAPIDTANPLLFLSTTRDPVTPLVNAQKMQSLFKGAGLSVTEGDGHCSTSAPSLCGAQAVRDYFQKGVLPREGLVCVPEVGPFDVEYGDGVWMENLDEDVRELAQAVRRLAKGFRGVDMPLGVW